MKDETSKNFLDYAKYYNAFYTDKDYKKESNYILDVLKKENHFPKTLLDLGCGTGKHGYQFALHNIEVTGIDLSNDMIKMGRDFLNSQNYPESASKPTLVNGNIQNFRLNKTFDTLTCLFHVISYQTTEEEILNCLKTAYEHLNNGGFFMFDFWYGPSVLKDRPSHREKTVQIEDSLITKISDPYIDINKNIVDVKYLITVKDKITNNTTTFSELHKMRYWFLPELLYLAKESNFLIKNTGGWLKDSEPTDDDWGAWILLQKKN